MELKGKYTKIFTVLLLFLLLVLILIFQIVFKQDSFGAVKGIVHSILKAANFSSNVKD